MRNKIVMVSTAIAMILGLTASPAKAAQVYGVLSNFDLYNRTEYNVNDLHLILRGNGLTCADISDYYYGWGTVSGVPTGGCQDLGGGKIEISWSAPSQPILPGAYQHFGVRLKSGAPTVRVIEAYWTLDGFRVARISFVTQTWVGYASCQVGDVVWSPDSIPQPPNPGPPWTISRAWAWSPDIIPLNNLTRSNPMVTGLNWSTPLVETMTGDPNIGLELLTDPLPQQGAVVIQYAVISTGPVAGDTLALFTNEAELEEEEQIPTLTEWGMIIFVVLLFGWMTFVVVRRWRRSQVTVA